MAKEWLEVPRVGERRSTGKKKVESHYRDKGDRRDRAWFKEPISKLQLRLKKLPTNLVIPGGKDGVSPARKIGGRVLQKAPDCSDTESERAKEKKRMGSRENWQSLCVCPIHKPRLNFATRESHSPFLRIFPPPPRPPKCDEARFARRMKRERHSR